jgi:PLP dependent protein
VQPIEEPELTPPLIRARYERLVDRLRQAATRAARDPAEVRIVAVTKGFGLPVVQAARAAGMSVFGENRVQEAEPKVSAMPDADWHLIGHLQSNKARRALALFATIHSVDSLELLARLERIAHDEGLHPRLLLQVNLSGEPQQSGFAPAELASNAPDLLGALADVHAVRVAGLMTIARYGAPDREARATFAALRDLRERLQHASGIALPELSMGMTADAEAAVAEGATLVRVGTAIFGPRPSPHGG